MAQDSFTEQVAKLFLNEDVEGGHQKILDSKKYNFEMPTSFSVLPGGHGGPGLGTARIDRNDFKFFESQSKEILFSVSPLQHAFPNAFSLKLKFVYNSKEDLVKEYVLLRDEMLAVGRASNSEVAESINEVGEYAKNAIIITSKEMKFPMLHIIGIEFNQEKHDPYMTVVYTTGDVPEEMRTMMKY